MLWQAGEAEQNHRRVLHKAPRRSKEERTYEENPYLTQAKTVAENQHHTRISRLGWQAPSHFKVEEFIINWLYIVHSTKRDDGIMNCFLTADTDELILGQEAVLENCLRTLQNISGEAELVDITDLIFLKLSPLTQQKLQQEQNYWPWNRGMTPDGFSDTWLKKT